MSLQTKHSSAVSAVKRRKTALLGSAVALGLTGVLAGEVLFRDAGPAQAQITRTQNLSEQGNLADKAPRQDQISFADIVETVKPAVVSVRVRSNERQISQNTEGQMPFFFRDLPQDHPLRRFFDENFGNREGRGATPGVPGPRGQNPRRFGQAQGSGFFISADGYAVTNNHVVENASEVELATDDGKTYKARVVGTDPRTDLAVLKVDKEGEQFKYVGFSTNVPRVGDWVVAIGNPFGLGGSVTAGIVSARGRDIGAGPYDDFIQIDAAVNRGNSGGPTFNLKGEVVGVNTAIYSPSGGNVGIAFAVPSEVALRVINELRDSGRVTRGWLGVQIQPITEDIASAIGLDDQRGALVVDAQSGTPAQKAGLQSGDAILEVNGERIADARELSRKIAGLKPGQKTDLTIWRNGRERDISVDLGKLPDEPRQARAPGGEDGGNPDRGGQNAPTNLADLGLKLQAAGRVPGSGNEGVVVTEVESDSPLSEKLRNGDVILEAGGKKVSSPSEVADAVKAAREKGIRSVLLRVKSGDNTRYVAIAVERG